MITAISGVWALPVRAQPEPATDAPKEAPEEDTKPAEAPPTPPSTGATQAPDTKPPSEVKPPSEGNLPPGSVLPNAKPVSGNTPTSASPTLPGRSDPADETSKPATAAVLGTAPPPRRDQATSGGFYFSSYGRMIAATDFRGGPGRDADIVAHGSRLDESNYVELELRRDDVWSATFTKTRLVATLAVANPVFHYNGKFDISLAVRNLYIEAQDLGVQNLTLWAGSRMYRGDDIYLLDWWPLDNLNTLGAGARYDFTESPAKTSIAIHGGLSQPDGSFFKQEVARPSPANGWGASTVNVLNRQKFTGSLRLAHTMPIPGDLGLSLKGVAYGEVHALPSGQKETEPGVFNKVSADDGYVIGAQVGGYTGERNTHLNLFVRYARGLAAYGEFATPSSLALDGTSAGAHEFLVAAGGNWETGPLGVMLGAYLRTFRNASPDLDFNDVDEGILVARPHFFLGESGGIAAELSYQMQQRGILAMPGAAPGEPSPDGASPDGPATGTITRIGIIPFLSPSGRGDYSRPQFRMIYVLTLRNDSAKALYPRDDVFNLRDVEHFFGVGAEWWFGSSYGG